MHPIPLMEKYYAYCPKVDPFSINFEDLIISLKENNCFAINFDVPDILITSSKGENAIEIFQNEGCVKSPRNNFMRHSLLLDLTQTEEQLFSNLHSKHRYNTRYARRKGVIVREEEGEHGFNVFYDLLRKTSEQQGFYIHPKEYYWNLWNILGSEGVARILTAYYQNIPLVSWMFFIYGNVLYYPYGGSSGKHGNLHPSNLLGWEGILLGKKEECEVFDMWGACPDLEDRSDPRWGYTNFKIKFGAEYVEYIPSYDLVLEPFWYKMFNYANEARWLFLNFKRGGF